MILAGSHVRLIPLSLDHYGRLCDIGLEPALWEHTTFRVETADAMLRYVQDALQGEASGTALPYAIALASSDETQSQHYPL